MKRCDAFVSYLEKIEFCTGINMLKSSQKKKKGPIMIKVLIFDSGYGGELFADWLNEEMPILDIIRIIDWRNAETILKSPKEARRVASKAIAPYIGKVDLVIFANHLLTVTSLRYFRRKYKNQKFIGLELPKPDSAARRDALILTTGALARTFSYQRYRLSLKTRAETLCLDSWPSLIDDGELSEDTISSVIGNFLARKKFRPRELILACAQFQDIKSELSKFFGRNIKIHDSYALAHRQICKTLHIRGGAKKRK